MDWRHFVSTLGDYVGIFWLSRHRLVEVVVKICNLSTLISGADDDPHNLTRSTHYILSQKDLLLLRARPPSVNTATLLGTDTLFRNCSTSICPHLAALPHPVARLFLTSLYTNDIPSSCPVIMLTTPAPIYQHFAINAVCAASLDH